MFTCYLTLILFLFIYSIIGLYSLDLQFAYTYQYVETDYLTDCMYYNANTIFDIQVPSSSVIHH